MSVTPKVRIYRVPVNNVAAVEPATLPACIVGPMAQITNYNSDKISSYIGVYGRGPSESISAKNQWLNTDPTVSPCFSGSFTGLEDDAVPDPDKCQIIGENVVVIVGISDLSSADAVASSGVVTIAKAKFIKAPATGDKVYLSTTSTGSPSVYTALSVKETGSNYDITVSPAPADGNYYWSVERSITEAFEFDKNYVWPSSTEIKDFYIYQGSKYKDLPVIYCKLYNSLVAPKVGASYGIEVVSSLNEIESKVGKVSEYNPLAFALYKALSVASTTVYYLPVRAKYSFDNAAKEWKFSYLDGFAEAKEKISSNTEVYRVVPLSSELSVISLFKIEAEERALPDDSIFRKVYGSVKIDNIKNIVDTDGSNIISIDSVADSQVNVVDHDNNAILTASKIVDMPIGLLERIYMGLGAVSDKVEIVDAEDSLGDKLTKIIGKRFDIYSVNLAESAGTYSLVAFKTVQALAESNTTLGKITLQFYRFDGAKIGSQVTINSDIELRNSSSSDFGSKRNKINFTSFNPISSGVEIGDYVMVKVPMQGIEPYGSSLWGYTVRPTETTVLLRITNVASNSVTISTSDGDIWNSLMLTLSVTNPSKIYFVEKLTDMGIVDEINAVTNNINSSCVINIFPWDLSVETPDGFVTMPAYYYAAALAALRSILPVHKSVTRYSIPGFKIPTEFKIIPRNTVNTISNMGVFTLVQDSDASNAYCLHQLTTTRSGIYYDEELSCSENLDEISRSTKKLYDAFIGRYNITSKVVGIMFASLESLLRSKMGSYYPDAGPQIESFSNLQITRGLMTSDGQYTAKPGYVTASFTVKIPEVLNNIDVYIYY